MKNNQELQKNIIKFYISQFLAGMQFTSPIIVLYFLSNGLSLSQVAILTSIHTLIIAFFEIPSGAIADIFGRKRTLVFAGLMAVIGSVTFAFSHSFLSFVLAEAFFALFISFTSGTDTAWLYDTLKNLKSQSKFKEISGRGSLIKSVVLFISQGAR